MPRHKRSFIFLAFLCGIAPATLQADELDRLPVGPQPDGRIVVPTNQILKPAGRQVTFPGRPVDLALAGDGQSLVVKNLRGLVFLDPATGQVKQTLASPTGFSVVGLAVQGKHVYDSDAQNHVRVARRRADGQFEWADGIPLAKPPAGGAANPAGLAWRSAAELWVCSTRGNQVQVLDPISGRAGQTVAVGVAPYALCFPRPDRCYVSNWGGDPPGKDDPQATSSGTAVRIDPRTGVASQGTISALAPRAGRWEQIKTLRVGLHPSGLTVSPRGRFVYVANAASDSVSVLDTARAEVVETISCRPEGRLPFGSGTNALARAPDGRTLYVANGTNNCVAVGRMAGPAPQARQRGPGRRHAAARRGAVGRRRGRARSPF